MRIAQVFHRLMGRSIFAAAPTTCAHHPRRFAQLSTVGLRDVEQHPDDMDDVLLFDLTDELVCKSWITGSDRDIGGESNCLLSFETEEDGSGYSVFSGDIAVEHSGKAVRTGYCGIRSPYPKIPINLEEFRALEIKIRSDLRRYSINVTSDGGIQTDVHQGFVQVDSTGWVTAEVPLETLIHIWKGRPSIFQRSLNTRKVLTVGVSLSDDVPGPFRLEIEYIKAKRKVADDAEILRRKLTSEEEKDSFRTEKFGKFLK